MKTRLLSIALSLIMTAMCFVPTLALAFDTGELDTQGETTSTTAREESTTLATTKPQRTTKAHKTTQKATKKSDKKTTSKIDTTATTVVEREQQEKKEEAQKTLEEQQKELEEKLAEEEKKLAELEKSSKNTLEYIDSLDRKIGYINRQLELLEKKNNKISKEMKVLSSKIKENEAKLTELRSQLDEAQAEYDECQDKFTSTYEAYCYRLKVIYMGGQFNLISALLSCKDLSGFYTRYQMIRSISKSDAELLKEVQEKMTEIETKKNGIDEIKSQYDEKQRELDSEKSQLVSKRATIEKNQSYIATQKVSLATDRAESDRLFAELTAENKQYSEFRNEDEELIASVEREIQELISGVKAPEEVTTAVADDSNRDKLDKQKQDETLDVYSKSDAVLNMTYPVPGHKSISAGYPNYSSGRYHGGIDFPCPTGSRVVAAQKGIVITVKRLNYSYGYYVMIYHGTDSLGRSVVTLYAHNSSILVNPGDSVAKGDTIARSGSTGNSTGPHCHFEVRFDGNRVNPYIYLS